MEKKPDTTSVPLKPDTTYGVLLIRRTFWIVCGIAGTVLLLWLAAVARNGAPTWPVADGALIEIYTQQAARGDQLLGAYSQYGWYHPGPLLFYLLAPFYVAGGRTLYGLDLGALAINLACLLIIATIIGRRRGISPLTAVLLLGGLFLYVARLPDLLTSAWNPHIPVWPFAALLLCTAATLDDSPSFLPVVVVLASLVTQTHVGFAPVALVLGGLALGAVVRMAAVQRARRPGAIAWMLLSIVVLQLVWLPVFADELAGRPGNLTRIWHFFFESAETQTLAATVRAWSSMLIAIVRPALTVAIGVGFSGSTRNWLIVTGALAVVALPVAAVLRWREGYRFESILAAVCFIASAIGFWSVLHIRGLIGDYQLFWLSVLGVYVLAIAASLIISSTRRFPATWLSPKPVAAIATLFGIGAVAVGAGQLVLATHPGNLPDENESVRRLTLEMRPALASMGARRPLFRIEGGDWGIGVGLMLQLARAELPFGVDTEFARRFDPNLAANGEEDVLVTFSGLEEHQQLAARPGNVTLASSNWRDRLYVDAVSLVDHPEYRDGLKAVPYR